MLFYFFSLYILLTCLSTCCYHSEGIYSSLHIINTKNSTINIQTPIAGPVHVTGCHETNVVIQFCHQLRIHDCINVSFELHVSSGPIIEGCKGMKFYQRDYVSNGEDKLGQEDNLYWDVKDFHWLKNLVKSPNFTTISSEEITPESQSIQKIRQTCNVENVSENANDDNDDDDESSDEDEL